MINSIPTLINRSIVKFSKWGVKYLIYIIELRENENIMNKMMLCWLYIYLMGIFSFNLSSLSMIPIYEGIAFLEYAFCFSRPPSIYFEADYGLLVHSVPPRVILIKFRSVYQNSSQMYIEYMSRGVWRHFLSDPCHVT